MNIAQTRQVLTYIWSTHPSAPKLEGDGKTATIASYFRILYKYSIDDVLEAVDNMCRESPAFISTAYEIERRCQRNIDEKPYLTDEYYETCRKLEAAEARKLTFEPQYHSAFDERMTRLRGVIYELLPEEKKAQLDSELAPLEAIISQYYDMNDECKRLAERRDKLSKRA